MSNKMRLPCSQYDKNIYNIYCVCIWHVAILNIFFLSNIPSFYSGISNLPPINLTQLQNVLFVFIFYLFKSGTCMKNIPLDVNQTITINVSSEKITGFSSVLLANNHYLFRSMIAPLLVIFYDYEVICRVMNNILCVHTEPVIYAISWLLLHNIIFF